MVTRNQELVEVLNLGNNRGDVVVVGEEGRSVVPQIFRLEWRYLVLVHFKVQVSRGIRESESNLTVEHIH